MVKKRLNKKGNIGIVLFGMAVIACLSLNSLIILERKTISIKRQNIHNAVVAANLASYKAIEQGDKSFVMRYNPTQLTNYLSNPNTIVSDGIALENFVNFMDSEYFDVGERYKSIYIKPNVAYGYFSDYLKQNLNLKNDSTYVFSPKSDSYNKGDIAQLKVNEFKVYNAIYSDLQSNNIPYEVPSETRKYTGIHLVLSTTVNKSAFVNTNITQVNVPIHLDTEVTLYRPTIK